MIHLWPLFLHEFFQNILLQHSRNITRSTLKQVFIQVFFVGRPNYNSIRKTLRKTNQFAKLAHDSADARTDDEHSFL